MCWWWSWELTRFAFSFLASHMLSNVNNNAKALIPKDRGWLYEPIYQLQWLSTWIFLLNSFWFSTISICKSRFLISFPLLSFKFSLVFLAVFLSLSSRASTFYLSFWFANTSFLHMPKPFFYDSLSSFSQLQLKNPYVYLRFEFYKVCPLIHISICISTTSLFLLAQPFDPYSSADLMVVR